MQTMSYDEWLEKYMPITRDGKKYSSSEDHSLSECIYEAREMSKEFVMENVGAMWSYVSEEGKDFLESGIRYVNTVGYVVTSRPHKDKRIIVEL